jgi:hypothetical protein
LDGLAELVYTYPYLLVHARARLTSGPEGQTAYLHADLRDPDSILNRPDLKDVLDLSQPVAVLLVAVLHFLTGKDDPYRLVRHLLAALPAGSYLVISHATADDMTTDERDAIDEANRRDGVPFQFRSLDEVTALFEGLELEEPGVVSIADWPGTRDGERFTAKEAACYGGMARISSPVRS